MCPMSLQLNLESSTESWSIYTVPLWGNLNSNYWADISTCLPSFSSSLGFHCCSVQFRKRQTHWGEVRHKSDTFLCSSRLSLKTGPLHPGCLVLLFSVFMCCFFLVPLIYVIVLRTKVKLLSCSIVTQSGISFYYLIYYSINMFVITLILENWF